MEILTSSLPLYPLLVYIAVVLDFPRLTASLSVLAQRGEILQITRITVNRLY